jgi:hypothetical protein
MSIKNTKVIKKPAIAKVTTTVKSSSNSKKPAKNHSKTALDLVRVNINMPRTLHNKIKQFIAKNDLTIHNMINTAVKFYINKPVVNSK